MSDDLILYISNNFRDIDHLSMLKDSLVAANKLQSSDIIKLYERLMTSPPGNNPRKAVLDVGFSKDLKVSEQYLANTSLF